MLKEFTARLDGARVDPSAAPRNGELIHLLAKEGSMLFFDAESGERLRRRGE